MVKWFKKWVQMMLFPDPNDLPDFTKGTFNFDTVVGLFFPRTNVQRPMRGDVVAVLDTCSMGMSVRKQTNAVIVDPYADQLPPKEKIARVLLDNGDKLFLADLRRLEGKPRMWVCGR